MDKSSSESLPLDHPIHDFTRTDKTFTDESANLLTERMIADRLSAALASGNLDTLEQARQSSLDHHPAENRAPSLPSPVRTSGESEAERFRQEAEALKAAERELDLRRAEVQAARKRAEERAQLQAAEAERQRIEAEAERRQLEDEHRLAELQAIRKGAEAEAKTRARKEQELATEILALRDAER